MFPIRDHNPSHRTPYVTYALIAVNTAIWLWSMVVLTSDASLSRFYYDFAMIPAQISGGAGQTGLVTSMFLHAGFLHLAGNMLFLFVFGDNLEDRMGHLPYAAFYIACGVGAALVQVMADPFSPVPTVGASGAVAGVMGGYLLLYPKARVDIILILIIFFKIFPVPAWIVLGVWFLMQVWGEFTAPAALGGVAYWAHIGGFVIGLGLALPLWLRLGGTAFWRQTHGHPPHPPASYMDGSSRIPIVRRRK